MPIAHCRYGDFSIPNESDLIFDAMRMYGEWAQQEIEILSRIIRPGAVVVDAGAFIGTHTRAFSEMIGDKGRVYAFEPNPTSYSLLLENTKLARFPNITTYKTALDHKRSTGILVPEQSENNLGATCLSYNFDDSNATRIFMRRLDDFNFERIDFIKADIEGMEYSMLLGAEKIILRDRPVIFLEANDLHASYPILGWAIAMEYVLLGVLTEAFNSSNFNGVLENVFGNALECGLLLGHKDEMPELQAALVGLDVCHIDSIDGLSVLLRCKPQYLDETLERKLVPESLVRKAKSKAEEQACSNFEKLQVQLSAMEEAKARAEWFAHSHSAEIVQLQARYAAMEEAKVKAEELAHSHSAELVKLQAKYAVMEEAKAVVENELGVVKSSRGYKLLSALKLAPANNAKDV